MDPSDRPFPRAVRALVPALLLALLLGGAHLARADDDAACPELDRVLMKNGRTFEGRISEEDDDTVVLVFPRGETGGGGQMRIPRALIERIERSTRPAAVPRPDGPVRDAWFLLRSDGRIIGTRHLTLRHVRSAEARGWHLEEEVVRFAQGRHVPAMRLQRAESVDLAFFPTRVHFREVGEAAPGSADLPRFERMVTGRVISGTWHAMIGAGGSLENRQVALPAGVRARLGTRENLLRHREIGIQEVQFLDPAQEGIVTARAGYTALDATDGPLRYDEFVWEEDGQRLVSRFRDAEVVEETIADGVVAVPCTEAQAQAAARDAQPGASATDGERSVSLPELGLELVMPSALWKMSRIPAPPEQSGWRRVAALEDDVHVTDVRIEWDPEGVRVAPDAADAEARLLQRLRSVCPDLAVVSPRRVLDGDRHGWQIELRGTLRGETVHTIAVVLDHGAGRALLLLASPDASWLDARPAFDALIASIRRL